MAAVLITVQFPDWTGQAITPTAAQDLNGFLVPNNGSTLIAVVNDNLALSTVTATIVTPQVVDGLALADKISVMNGQTTLYFNRLNPATYNDTLGRVAITLSNLVQNGAASAPTYPNVFCWAAR